VKEERKVKEGAFWKGDSGLFNKTTPRTASLLGNERSNRGRGDAGKGQRGQKGRGKRHGTMEKVSLALGLLLGSVRSDRTQ